MFDFVSAFSTLARVLDILAFAFGLWLVSPNAWRKYLPSRLGI